MNCFSFRRWNFYAKERHTWSVCNKSANCNHSHYVDGSCGV